MRLENKLECFFFLLLLLIGAFGSFFGFWEVEMAREDLLDGDGA